MKRIIMKFVILSCMLVILACQGNEAQNPESDMNNVSTDVSVNQEVIDTNDNNEKDNFVVAKVDDILITSMQVENELNTLMAQYQLMVPKEQLDALRPKMEKQAVENLINKELLLREAESRNIQVSSEDIDKQLNSIVSRFPSEEVFDQQITKMGTSKEKLVKNIEQQLKISSLLKSSMTSLKAITDDDVKVFYQENKDKFKEPEQVHAKHILFKINASDPSDVKDKKRKDLEVLRNKIKNGEDFSEMAKEYSEGPTNVKGGDLGYFGRGQMVKPFEEVAFGLKDEGLSDIVETQFGYHLIKVIDHKEARLLPFEEAKANITTYLKSKQEQDDLQKYLGELKATAKIEYTETKK